MTKFLILFLSYVMIINSANSQEKTVKGNVTDDLGVPLPGATILIENTTQGVTSDFDGNFSINASEGDTLINKLCWIFRSKADCRRK